MVVPSFADVKFDYRLWNPDDPDLPMLDFEGGGIAVSTCGAVMNITPPPVYNDDGQAHIHKRTKPNGTMLVGSDRLCVLYHGCC
jgi:hypothetical protein